MASLFRKFSFTPQMSANSETQSDDAPMVSEQSRRKSSTMSMSQGRIYGARDYKLSIDSGRPRSRHSSCTSTLVDAREEPEQSRPDLKLHHRTYGSRDYKLMIPKEAERARRNSILEDYSTPSTNVIQYKYSIPYGARDHALAVRDRRIE